MYVKESYGVSLGIKPYTRKALNPRECRLQIAGRRLGRNGSAPYRVATMANNYSTDALQNVLSPKNKNESPLTKGGCTLQNSERLGKDRAISSGLSKQTMLDGFLGA
jgi:hypothetical protein